MWPEAVEALRTLSVLATNREQVIGRRGSSLVRKVMFGREHTSRKLGFESRIRIKAYIGIPIESIALENKLSVDTLMTS